MKKLFLTIIVIFAISFPIIMEAAEGGPVIAPAQYIPLNPGGTNNNPESSNSEDTYTTSPGSSVRSGGWQSLQDAGEWAKDFIVGKLIPLVIGIALLVFLWGVLKYIYHGSNEEEHTEGRSFMLWGIIGLFVMVSVWGLVQIFVGTLGETIGIPSLNRLK